MSIQGVGLRSTIPALRPGGFASAVLQTRLEAPPTGDEARFIGRDLPPPLPSKGGFWRQQPDNDDSTDAFPATAFAPDGQLPGEESIPAALRTPVAGAWRRLGGEVTRPLFEAPELVLEFDLSGYPSVLSAGLPDAAPLAGSAATEGEIDLRGQLMTASGFAAPASTPPETSVLRACADGSSVHGRGGVRISAEDFGQLLALLGASSN